MKTRKWLIWFGVLALLALAMWPIREELDKAHITIAFLLVVLGGSAAEGRALGISLAATAFLVFNWVFLPPYNTLVIANPLDWLVLIAFLITGVVAAQLLEKQRRAREEAERRAAEIDRLATLGAETLNAPRAEDALDAIASVIRDAMGVEQCVIATGGAAPSNASTLSIALNVRERVVGTLRLSSSRPFELTPDQRRVLAALSYYAALGLERVRLTDAAAEAESLRRADRLKDALLASVSHDLRTPLTAIKGIANEVWTGGDPSRAMAIEEEADRLNELVDDLLEFSQINAGVVRFVPTINTADEVVGTALERVEAAHGTGRIDAHVANEGAILVGEFDLAHATRALTNLLENALKYSPAASPVVLRVVRHDGRVRFTVEDSGSGVAVGDEEKIFDPFYRGAAASADTRGTGLGLAIARQLVSAQRGTLVYERREKGGSRFVMELPAVTGPVQYL
ncbi:MAG: ATP-binding region ATPase domain protein [Gemmatimonadetes bacterium]|nr:ATP-binding region ATPase domain protein [Gemmatimonadota bacterium]